jgi:hypothetical protein
MSKQWIYINGALLLVLVAVVLGTRRIRRFVTHLIPYESIDTLPGWPATHATHRR